MYVRRRFKGQSCTSMNRSKQKGILSMKTKQKNTNDMTAEERMQEIAVILARAILKNL